jgi:hypothetical protein
LPECGDRRQWRHAAREDRDVVTARESGVDEMPAEKARAAQDEEFHAAATVVTNGTTREWILRIDTAGAAQARARRLPARHDRHAGELLLRLDQ